MTAPCTGDSRSARVNYHLVASNRLIVGPSGTRWVRCGYVGPQPDVTTSARNRSIEPQRQSGCDDYPSLRSTRPSHLTCVCQPIKMTSGSPENPSLGPWFWIMRGISGMLCREVCAVSNAPKPKEDSDTPQPDHGDKEGRVEKVGRAGAGPLWDNVVDEEQVSLRQASKAQQLVSPSKCKKCGNDAR